MAIAINAPASCELHSVICFLQVEESSTTEIHCRMSVVYGEHCMSHSALRKWCRKFAQGQTDTHNEGGQGRKSVVTANLVDQFIRENRRFSINEQSLEFPDISRSPWYKIVTTNLDYRKLYAHWVTHLNVKRGPQNEADGVCSNSPHLL